MNEFGFEYGFGFFIVLDIVFIMLIFGLVNFVYLCVNGCQYVGCVVFVLCFLCYCYQCGDVNYWQFCVKCQFLCNVNINVYVGKVIGVVFVSQSVNISQGSFVGGQDILYYW